MFLNFFFFFLFLNALKQTRALYALNQQKMSNYFWSTGASLERTKAVLVVRIPAGVLTEQQRLNRAGLTRSSAFTQKDFVFFLHFLSMTEPSELSLSKSVCIHNQKQTPSKLGLDEDKRLRATVWEPAAK